jgi:DNA polymerase-3 subunit delta
MKYAAKDLPAFLKANPKPVHAALIYGPDEGLVRDTCKQIGESVVESLGDAFNVKRISDEQIKEDRAILFSELSAMSLTGDKRLVWVETHSEKASKTIEEALEMANEECFLLISAGELTPRSTLRKCFESSQGGFALPCYKQEGAMLHHTIESMLKQQNITYGSDVIIYLSEHLGIDRGITLKEMDKIITYLGEEKELTLEKATLLIGNFSDVTVDSLCHAMATGQFNEMESALHTLFHEGNLPIMVIRSVLRFYFRLQKAALSIADGTSTDQAIKELKPPVFFKQIPAMKSHLSFWRIKEIHFALQQLYQAETNIKSGAANPENVCHYYISEITRLKMRVKNAA